MTASYNEAEHEIRQLFHAWQKALEDKDVERRTTHYAPDVLLFDVVNPLQHRGIGPLRERLSTWLSSFDGPVNAELRDLTITTGNDTAFCTSLQRFRGTLETGAQLDMWVRYTTCLHKLDGTWQVTHEHASVPFDPGTGMATLATAP